MKRREFLMSSAAAAGVGLVPSGLAEAQDATEAPRMKKSILLGMLPLELEDGPKFKMAKELGFEGIEGYPVTDAKDLEMLETRGEVAREAGVPIHSLMFGGWHAPFSDPDSAVVAKGMAGMELALRSAKAVGAGAVLLVPAHVKDNVRYVDAYARSQEAIRKLIPLAQELDVLIAVENVWNDFLLSPIEFARYVDEFESPWVQAYFDIGNVALFGYPQDWIRTLDKRIVRVHIKDFHRKEHRWTPLYEGTIQFGEVHTALKEIGYAGYVNCELPAGSPEYLKEISRRMDLFMQGQAALSDESSSPPA